MKIYIKNMVCSRCIMIVKAELDRAGIAATSIALGEVETAHIPEQSDMQSLAAALSSLGFEIYNEKKTRLVASIKQKIEEFLDASEFTHGMSLSEYISNALHQDYSAVSSLFSYMEDTTLEQYYIARKVERVKENIIYSDLTLSEIANKLGYSSVAHLSTQFKKVTGYTPSFFKAIRETKKQLGK